MATSHSSTSTGNSAPNAQRASGEAPTSLLIRPYLTEKSSRLAELGQYTFLVVQDAEKVSIAREVARRYQVHPVGVSIVRIPGKIVRHGKTSGRRSALKKAIITVRAGEKIPFGVKS